MIYLWKYIRSVRWIIDTVITDRLNYLHKNNNISCSLLWSPSLHHPVYIRAWNFTRLLYYFNRYYLTIDALKCKNVWLAISGGNVVIYISLSVSSVTGVLNIIFLLALRTVVLYNSRNDVSRWRQRVCNVHVSRDTLARNVFKNGGD